MSALRSMGLPAALLAATGGVALATWRYLSARRQKSAEHGEAPRAEEEEGNVEVVSTQDGEEPDPLRISQQQVFIVGTTEDVSPVHSEERRTGSQGSDENAPPGTSCVWQKEKNAAAPVTSITREEKNAADPVTSMTAEEKRTAAPVTSMTAEEKHAADPVTSMTAEQKHAAAPVTSMTAEEKRAAAPVTSMTAEEKHAAASVTSMTAEEKHTAAPVTSMTAEEKRAAAPVTSMTAEEKRAAAPVTSMTAEEKRAAAPVTSMTAEEKRAAAPVISMTAEEKRAAAPVTSMTAEEKRAAAVVTSLTLKEKREKTSLASMTALENMSSAAPAISITCQEKSAVVPVTSMPPKGENNANPNSAALQGNASVLQEEYHIVESSTLQEQCDISSIKTKEETPKSPTSSIDPPVDKGISESLSSAEIQHKEKHASCKQVLVIGLDGSGKTSILNSIAGNKGKLITTPTEGVNAMCVSNGNSKMEFLEIGGSEQLRPYWKMYLARAFAVIFVVDSADHDRLPLAKRHLHQLIQQDPILPLIVLANKQDLENAQYIPEIHDALALSEICENRKLFLIGTYVTKEGSEISSGIQDAKEFLAQLLLENSAEI